MIVADCTLIAHLFIRSDHTAHAADVLRRDPAWAVPRLWRSEMRSVLRKYMRADRLTLDAACEVMLEAEAILATTEYDVSSPHVLSVVAASGCSAYDAEYVAMAQALGVPLVTSDSGLLARFSSIALAPGEFAKG